MQPSIAEFNSSDWGQYFNDTYIQYQSKAGVRVARIENFLDNERVMVQRNNNSIIINVKNILWRGLLRTRCVAYDGALVFIGPSGARSHKKPPNGSNMSALCYNRGRIPVLMGSTSRSSISHELILAYLSDDDMYPQTRDDIRSLLETRRAVPVSQRSGIFLSPHDGVYYCITDGLIILATHDLIETLRWAEEVRNDVP